MVNYTDMKEVKTQIKMKTKKTIVKIYLLTIR